MLTSKGMMSKLMKYSNDEKGAGNKQKKLTEIEIDVVYKLYHVVQNVYQDFVYQMWSTFCTTVDIALKGFCPVA